MDWQEWIQDVGGSVIKSAADAKYSQPYEVQKLQLQALGANGLLYPEGRPAGTTAAPLFNTGTMLLIGGAVLVAAFVLRD